MLNTKIENFFLSLPIWPLIAKRWSQIYCHSISMTHSDFLLLFWTRSIDSMLHQYARAREVDKFFPSHRKCFFSVCFIGIVKSFSFVLLHFFSSLWCSKIVKNMVRNGCMKREEETMMIPICDRWLCITTVKFKNDKLKKFPHRIFFLNLK